MLCLVSGKITDSRNVMFNEEASWNFDSESVSSNIKLSPTDEVFSQEPATVLIPGNSSSSSQASSSLSTPQSSTSAPSSGHCLTPKEAAAVILQQALPVRLHQRNSVR